MLQLVGDHFQPAFCPRIVLLSQVGIYPRNFFFGKSNLRDNRSTVTVPLLLFVYFLQAYLFWFSLHIYPPDLKVIILFLIFLKLFFTVLCSTKTKMAVLLKRDCSLSLKKSFLSWTWISILKVCLFLKMSQICQVYTQYNNRS